jgi:hypothetical protein
VNNFNKDEIPLSTIETWTRGELLMVYEEPMEKLRTENKAQQAFINKLVEVVKDYKNIIKYTHDTCLCKRFETNGFDYGEKHPNRETNNGGMRPKTPRGFIEAVIGFEWKYGAGCKSWKELKLNEIQQSPEWKQFVKGEGNE